MQGFDAAEEARRLDNLVRLGVIEQADYQRARARVRIGALLTDWLPWLSRRAGGNRSWEALEEGEQVLVASPCGDPAQGIIIGPLYRKAHPAPAASVDLERTVYQDGASLSYDRKRHHWLLEVPPEDGAAITLRIGASSLILAPEKITLACGGSSITLEDEHITQTSARIDLN